MPGWGVTAPSPSPSHPPSTEHGTVPSMPGWREPSVPFPRPGSSPSFRLLLRTAKNCSRSISMSRFSQQEALPAGETPKGLRGDEGSYVVG